MYISLNNIDIFCLHIFEYVLSSCQIDFIKLFTISKCTTIFN